MRTSCTGVLGVLDLLISLTVAASVGAIGLCCLCCICCTTRVFPSSSRKMSLYSFDVKVLHPNDIGVVCRHIHHVVKIAQGPACHHWLKFMGPCDFGFHCCFFLCECISLRNINSFLIVFIVILITL